MKIIEVIRVKDLRLFLGLFIKEDYKLILEESSPTFKTKRKEYGLIRIIGLMGIMKIIGG